VAVTVDGVIAVTTPTSRGVGHRIWRIRWGQTERSMKGSLVFDGRDEVAQGTPTADTGFTDEELTALALAAEPGAPIGHDAVPLAVYLGQSSGPLPQWYMPSPMTRVHAWWRLPVVTTIVGAFLIIEALGLCNTYGILGIG
jgi:hypothetical protein